MEKQFTIKDVTPAIKSGVRAYVIAKAYAETMRQEVDKIHREILTECPIYADHRGKTQQILESKDLYLCSDDNLCQDFYAESNKRLKKIGLKPNEMQDDFCPALVAENLQVTAAQVLIEASGKVFKGITANKLLCAGLDKYNKWVDLLCSLVISLPDWENPKF